MVSLLFVDIWEGVGVQSCVWIYICCWRYTDFKRFDIQLDHHHDHRDTLTSTLTTTFMVRCVLEWTVPDVCDWLDSLFMPEYKVRPICVLSAWSSLFEIDPLIVLSRFVLLCVCFFLLLWACFTYSYFTVQGWSRLLVTTIISIFWQKRAM